MSRRDFAGYPSGLGCLLEIVLLGGILAALAAGMWWLGFLS